MAIVVSERAEAIDAHIKAHPGCKIIEALPVAVGGSVQRLPVYRLPIRLLSYNLRNGRFAVELVEREGQLNRHLDPYDPEDAKEIQQLLLNLNPDRTQQLERDLRAKGQLEPGVITHDGSVINGNRRVAILDKMHEDEPIDRWEYLEVHRLPQDVEARDLWRLEATLQLSRDTRLDYSPINELLKLREGVNAGLSPKELAGAMFGRTEEEVKDELHRLAIIDSYLEYIGHRGEYHRVAEERVSERFIEIQKSDKSFKRKGTLDPSGRHDWLLMQFECVRTGRITSGALRDVRKMAEDPDASAVLEPLMERARTEGASIGIQRTVDLYKDAQEVLENKKYRERPGKLLDRAIRALEVIDTSHPHFSTPQNYEKVKRIRQIVVKLLAGVPQARE
jgi:hypothetical protein